VSNGWTNDGHQQRESVRWFGRPVIVSVSCTLYRRDYAYDMWSLVAANSWLVEARRSVCLSILARTPGEYGAAEQHLVTDVHRRRATGDMCVCLLPTHAVTSWRGTRTSCNQRHSRNYFRFIHCHCHVHGDTWPPRRYRQHSISGDCCGPVMGKNQEIYTATSNLKVDWACTNISSLTDTTIAYRFLKILQEAKNLPKCSNFTL